MAALRFSDGTLEWNGVRYADEDSLYEAADMFCGRNLGEQLVIIEKCGNDPKSRTAEYKGCAAAQIWK